MYHYVVCTGHTHRTTYLNHCKMSFIF